MSQQPSAIQAQREAAQIAASAAHEITNPLGSSNRKYRFQTKSITKMASVVKILIADDHELFRRTLRRFIESQPDWHICGEASDGVEALKKAKELLPDVVLMDINMPVMNGLEATRILRRELPACKVVIVTQHDASIARDQAATVDASAFLTKADLTRDLRLTLESVLESNLSDPSTSRRS